MNDHWEEETHPAAVLTNCRRRIDRIDGVLLALLRERLVVAMEAADAKTALGEPLEAPSREAEVLARVAALASSPLDARVVTRIFNTIIEETRSAEERFPRYTVLADQRSLTADRLTSHGQPRR